MSRLDIASIRARAEAATKNMTKWNPRFNGRVMQGAHLGQTLIGLDDTYEGSDEDCAFLAAARTDVPALCDRVEALELREQLLEDRLAHEYAGPVDEAGIRSALYARGLPSTGRIIDTVIAAVAKQATRIEALEAALREALNEYAEHQGSCAYRKAADPCSCGLDERRAALEGNADV